MVNGSIDFGVLAGNLITLARLESNSCSPKAVLNTVRSNMIEVRLMLGVPQEVLATTSCPSSHVLGVLTEKWAEIGD